MTPGRDQAATLRELRRRASPRRGAASVLAVTSGKGGVGKTVIAVNLALRLASNGVRTLLVDLDAGLANVDVHMRLHPRATVVDVLRGHCTAEEAVLVGPEDLWIVPGGSLSSGHADSSPDGTLSPDRAGPALLLDALEAVISRVDVVILDTGAGVGPWVVGALEAADHALVVTQPDPASVTDAYALVKVCRRLERGATPSLIVNRIASKNEALLTATRVRRVASRFLGYEPPLTGWLHELTDVGSSVRNQSPFLLDLPSSHRAVLDMSSIAARALDVGRSRLQSATVSGR